MSKIIYKFNPLNLKYKLFLGYEFNDFLLMEGDSTEVIDYLIDCIYEQKIKIKGNSDKDEK